MIIKLKCPRCNAALEVNVSKDFFFCPYCGIRLERASKSPIVQKTINHNNENGSKIMKEYALEQRRFNEKVFGRGTRNIDSVEGLMNKYAKEG